MHIRTKGPEKSKYIVFKSYGYYNALKFFVYAFSDGKNDVEESEI